MINGNRAVLYLRLSKEDIDKANKGDDSESIKNQRLLLTDYALSKNFQIIDVYSDDDESGLYNDRPDFARMINDAKLGKFDIILCKTQNRFTRNMAHAEQYLNHDLPLMGIRFIGVIDNVDTAVKGNKKSRQVNALVDEWYCEGLSENIKTVFKQKMKAGQFLGAFAPYGYLKDPNNKHNFIIDDYASGVVRKIYDLYLHGHGLNAIAKILEDEKILPPSEYKKQQGFSYNTPHKSFCSKGLWSLPTIRRMLHDEVYIGKLQQGKVSKISYKDRGLISNDKKDWIVVENHHEKIIDEQTFYQVQEIMGTRRKVCENQGKDKICHPLSGKVFCKKCNTNMIKHNGNYRALAKDKDSWYFACRLRRKTHGQGCDNKSIMYREIKSDILANIKYFNELTKNPKNKELLLSQLNNNDYQQEINRLQTDIDKLNKTLDKNSTTLKTLYADRVSGVITVEDFLELKKSFEKENAQTKQTVLDKTCKLEQLKSKVESKIDFFEIVKKYGDVTDLSVEMVNQLISAIYVGEVEEDGTREIEIKWKI